MAEMDGTRKDTQALRTDMARMRTSLANRRTFLAWCRTALSFMTFGFLLEKIDAFVAAKHSSVSESLLEGLGTLGSFVFLVGPVLVIFAGYRYYQVDKELGMQSAGSSILPEILMLAAILAAALIFILL